MQGVGYQEFWDRAERKTKTHLEKGTWQREGRGGSSTVDLLEVAYGMCWLRTKRSLKPNPLLRARFPGTMGSISQNAVNSL